MRLLLKLKLKKLLLKKPNLPLMVKMEREAVGGVAVVEEAEAKKVKEVPGEALTVKKREVDTEVTEVKEVIEEEGETGEGEITVLMLRDSRQSKLVVIEILEAEAAEEVEVTEAAGEELTAKNEEVETDQEPAEEEVRDHQEEELVKRPKEIFLELQPPLLSQPRLRNER